MNFNDNIFLNTNDLGFSPNFAAANADYSSLFNIDPASTTLNRAQINNANFTSTSEGSPRN